MGEEVAGLEYELEKQHDEFAAEFADLKADVISNNEQMDLMEAMDITQEVNIDLDLGGKDDSMFQAFEILSDLEWWHFLIIGLGIVLVSIGSWAFTSCKDRASLEDRLPLIPQY